MLALGTSVLVSTQTEVDKTGQSYYGETNLYYLGSEGLSSQVHLGMSVMSDTLPPCDSSCRQAGTNLRFHLEPQWQRVCRCLRVYAG